MSSVRGSRQLALFGVGRVPNLWTYDLRSVGELLADTDLQSRHLLHDMVPDDALALTVAWPGLLFAAQHLWNALPPAPTRVAAEAERRTMDLLAARGNGYLTALHQGRLYLAAVPPDPRLIEITESLERAATLVERFGGGVNVEKEPARSDLRAARARVLHTLFLTIHAVHASVRLLRNGVATGTTDPASSPLPDDWSSSKVGEVLDSWTQRLGSTEAAVCRALGGSYPHDLVGEFDSCSDAQRLPRALATWELGIHRVLSTTPTHADLELIARCEGLIAATAHILITRPCVEQASELARCCETAAAAWAKAAAWWNLLTSAGSTANPHLVAVAAELRAATRAFTFDHALVAAPASIASRPGYTAAVDGLLAALEDGREVAGAITNCVVDSELRGPARALSWRTQDLCEGTVHERDEAWIAPADVMANRLVPLPRPLFDALLHDTDALDLAARLAASAAVQAGAVDTRLAYQPRSGQGLGVDDDPAVAQEIEARLAIGI